MICLMLRGYGLLWLLSGSGSLSRLLGNRLVRGFYVGLPLPWECGSVGEDARFERETFVRME